MTLITVINHCVNSLLCFLSLSEFTDPKINDNKIKRRKPVMETVDVNTTESPKYFTASGFELYIFFNQVV